MQRIAFAVVLSVASFGAHTALACSCWRPTVEEHVSSVDAVFSGRVYAIQGHRSGSYVCSRDWGRARCREMAVAEVLVDELYKGPPGNHQSVRFVWDDGGLCGWGFTIGEDVVIFANFDQQGDLMVTYCSQIPFSRPEMRREYMTYLDGLLLRRAESEAR